MGNLFAGDRMEDDLRWREERERRLAEKKDLHADETDATVHEAVEFQEKDDEDIYFAPEKGNVIFASAIDGWGFRVAKFAQLYAAKLGIKEANLRRVLWGDFFLDPKTKKVISYKHLRGRALKPLFVQFVLENIWAVYDAIVLNPCVPFSLYRPEHYILKFVSNSSNSEKVTKIVGALNLKIPLRDLKSKDTRHLLSLVFSQWLSLSTCIIQTVIDVVPAPCAAQSTRIPKMIYPDLYETTLTPKNKLEEDLFASKSGPDACVSAYVSKMFAVAQKDLPENKKKPLTADEMRARARKAREVKNAAADASSNETAPTSVDILSNITEPEALEDEAREIILGFARLYSGTIRTGTAVYGLLPKYNMNLDPTHPHNTKYLITAHVEGLYVMMGRDLVPVDYVTAGNIFAVKGLEGKVWRSATLCAPGEVGIGDEPDARELKDCLINLGGIANQVSLWKECLYHITEG